MSDYQPGCSDPDGEHDPTDSDDEDLDGPIRCWCGVEGLYDELFDDDSLDKLCGGMGSLHCYCGGDQCVCHNHGETWCDGCDDCEPEDDDEYDLDLDDEDYE